MDNIRVDAGAIFGRKGEPIEYLNVLLEVKSGGEFGRARHAEIYRARGAGNGRVPFSRLKTYVGNTWAVLPVTCSAAIDHFWKWWQRIPVLGSG